MEDVLQFRVSSALKDLIGRELITDEFVAVFELVKNSFDAGAKNVQIVFENKSDDKTAKILIKDNGCGMNLVDIQSKWLFVGYSEKRELRDNVDYRDKLVQKRIFAGAKGVGRFSCDRLGSYLRLITRKNDSTDSFIHNLDVDWTSFESNSSKDFINVDVNHKIIDNAIFPNESSFGTILEISNLRDKWTRKRILELRASLGKLINPIQDNDVENFAIEIISEDELAEDKEHHNTRDKVNGPIQNFVFEALELKTTQINVSIDSHGNTILTKLIDRGIPIFTLTERNIYGKLSNINISLFVLNRAGKLGFYKIMGMPSVQYGSVFIYKNGFRIYPFGEEGDDTLKIDRRKQQGFYRYIGTRDLIGRIEINGESSELKETTSRDGGLVKNQSYNQLVSLFYDKALKRLENYAVGIIKWGDERFDKDGDLIQPELHPEDVKEQIIDIIANLTKAQDVIDIEYNEDFLQIYEQKQIKSASKLAQNFVKIAEKSNNVELVNQAKLIEKSIKDLKKAKCEAEKETEEAKKEQQKKEEILSQVRTENIFLLSDVNADVAQLTSLHHQITHTSNTIDEFVIKTINAIQDKDYKIALGYLNYIHEENQKISTLSNYVSKAKFNTKIKKIEENIIKFVNEYITNVYACLHTDLKIYVDANYEQDIRLRFSPVEMIMVLDNLFNNSEKAYKNMSGIKRIDIKWTLNENLVMSYRDYAYGISDDVLPRVFDYRFSTTGGGGLGMFHVKEILSRIGATIEINNKVNTGVEFIITFKI